MKVRLAIRGYVNRTPVFQQFLVVDESGDGLEDLAAGHAKRLLAMPGGERHMIEIEFLDETNPQERFFRIGTDPAGMVKPVPVGFRD